MDILIFILGFILIAVIFTPRKNRETFKIKRKRPSGKIRIGTLNNTPGPMKGLMANLNIAKRAKNLVHTKRIILNLNLKILLIY